MGICHNSNLFQKYFCCNKSTINNNIIIINLAEEMEKKLNEQKKDLNKKNDSKDMFGKKNNEIVIYKIQSKFKSKLKAPLNNNKFQKDPIIINNNRTNETNNKKFKDNFDKLIHFTSFNNNISVTTNSIIK